MLTRGLAMVALAFAFMAAPLTAMGQAATYKGAIIAKETDKIVVRTAEGDKTVRVGPGTKIEKVVGAVGLRRDSASQADLIRGLAIEFSATPAPDGDELVASSVLFKPGDLRTAKQIEAGVYGAEERISETEKRLDNVGELVALDRTKVFFDVGKSTLSDEGKHNLQALAAKAKGIKGGFRLAAVGRADPTGDAEANRRLSARRAYAVTAYLTESCGIRPGQILPMNALGASTVADDPDPPKTNAEGRRVTVTILVSKANTAATGQR